MLFMFGKVPREKKNPYFYSRVGAGWGYPTVRCLARRREWDGVAGNTPKTSSPPRKDPPGAAPVSRVLPNCCLALLEV